eukprot:3183995-Pleurochrysis_carterae.AAC.1
MGGDRRRRKGGVNAVGERRGRGERSRARHRSVGLLLVWVTVPYEVRAIGERVSAEGKAGPSEEGKRAGGMGR